MHDPIELNPFLIFLPLGIMALLGAIFVFARGLQWLAHGGAASHHNNYMEFMDYCEAMGMDYPTALDEWYLREQLARVRREASDQVATRRSDFHIIIESVVYEALERISGERPHLVNRFQSMVQGLSYGQILYPHEARLVDEQFIGIGHGRPSPDQRAALRIVKGG